MFSVTTSTWLHSTQSGTIDALWVSTHRTSSDLAISAGSLTFERIAAMFQSLLSEEAIPIETRFWLARLQTPLFRIAVTGCMDVVNQSHPARRLVNALFFLALDAGSDPQKVKSARIEIKRTVQLIEQFPEYGERTYELLLTELSAKAGPTTDQSMLYFSDIDPVDLLEQRDALKIRFTIDLRESIKSKEMSWSFRLFFLSVWSKILASSALREGFESAQFMQLKKVEAELLTLSELTPYERSIATVKGEETLKRLEEGMTQICLTQSERDLYREMFFGPLDPQRMPK